MSFPRAKIQRFNDVQYCTPSPAHYNPEIKNQISGGIICRQKLLNESSSLKSSEEVSTPLNSNTCFRKPLTASRKTLVFMNGSIMKSQSTSNVDMLKAKVVECSASTDEMMENAESVDAVKELLTQKAALKTEGNYSDDVDQPNKDNIQIIEDLKSLCEMYSSLLNDQTNLNNNATIQNETIITNLHESFKDVQCIYEITTDIHIEDMKFILKLLEEREGTIKELQEKVALIMEEHTLQLDAINVKQKEFVDDINATVKDVVTHLETCFKEEKMSNKKILEEFKTEEEITMENIRQLYEKEALEIYEHTEAKIRQIEAKYKEANALAEIQLQEKCKSIELNWKLQLQEQERISKEILEECQAISEYNVFMSEVEKNQVKRELEDKCAHLDCLSKTKDDLTEQLRDLEEKHNVLKSDYLLITTNLQDKIKDLEKKKETLEIDFQRALFETRNYEVTIKKTHKTIETLTKRLFESDRDVEQLKRELETCETLKLESDAKCNCLLSDTKTLTEINESLKIELERAGDNFQAQILAIQEDLLRKVDEYKNVTDTVYKDNNKLRGIIEELKKHVHDEQVLNCQNQVALKQTYIELERKTAENIELIFTQKRLETRITDLLEDLNQERENSQKLPVVNKELSSKLEGEKKSHEKFETSKMMVIDESHQLKQQINYTKENVSCQTECEHHKTQQRKLQGETEANKTCFDRMKRDNEALSQKYEEMLLEVDKLKKTVAEQELLIEPFREQLEQYEIEKSTLLDQKCDAENEIKSLSLKYAEMLGHQNHKQKIKYMVDLKAKNLQLKDVNEELNAKVRSQNKVIIKLKNELAHLMNKSSKLVINGWDKENYRSPNRCTTPNNVSSPLRDKN